MFTGSPDSYNCTFPAMIDDWRMKWYNASMNQTTPLYFGFAQVCTYTLYLGNSRCGVEL